MKSIQFKKGQRVWWNDPACETSDYFTVISDVQADIKELQDQGGDKESIHYDLIILLAHEAGGEAEAHVWELEPVYYGTFEELSGRIKSVHADLQMYIKQKLRENNGRIAIDISEEAKEECDCDSDLYPIISTLYGKHGDNPNIGITDVYLKDSSIYAGGIDTGTGCEEIDFAITPDQYHDVAYFIKKVLEL